jgi:hypothetical protein
MSWHHQDDDVAQGAYALLCFAASALTAPPACAICAQPAEERLSHAWAGEPELYLPLCLYCAHRQCPICVAIQEEKKTTGGPLVPRV